MKLIVLFCLVWSGLAWSFNFGVQGRDGRDGRSGTSGANGDSMMVHVDGTRSLNIQSNGRNGGDAIGGDNGSDAYACHQRRGRFNEFGARGGNGGNGGVGGAGGDGGDVTIFYQDDAHLGQVFISNKGGNGGQGSYGGYAGRGCQCYDRSWTHRVCRAEQRCTHRRVCDGNNRNCRTERHCRPVRVCRNEYYTCHDGRDGINGRIGTVGRNGAYGKIKVVKGLTSIPSQNAYAELTIGQLSQSDFVLSKRIWKTKNNGHARFATGSQISGNYLEFVELRTHSIGIDWRANRNINEFANKKIPIRFDGARVHFTLPEGLFIKYKLEQGRDQTTIVVEKIYTLEEVRQLKILSTKGHGKDLIVTIEDKNSLSEAVESEIKLEWVHRKWRIWYKVFDQLVPKEHMLLSPDKIEIHIGNLGISPAYIARGKMVRYTLWIKRKLGNNFTEVKLHQRAIQLR